MFPFLAAVIVHAFILKFRFILKNIEKRCFLRLNSEKDAVYSTHHQSSAYSSVG